MKVAQMFGATCVVFLVLILSLGTAMATDALNLSECYDTTPAITVSFSNQQSLILGNFGIQNNCVSGTAIRWTDPVDLVLGPVLTGEVVIAPTSIYVDSIARPDLDNPATLVFRNIPFAVEPSVKRNDLSCGDCNVTFDAARNDLYVQVPGFSNYSLSARQDFVVYSDTRPEEDAKIYQTIDLGDSNRATEFACIVQIFGQSVENTGQWVLVQTNPQREVQARLLGNPDANQPESLGYFKTTGGMANVYFRDQNIPGYNDFEYVVQCSSNSTKLIYEEAVSPTYHPMGRTMVARGIWLTQGYNMFFAIIALVILGISAMLVWKAVKTWR